MPIEFICSACYWIYRHLYIKFNNILLQYILHNRVAMWLKLCLFIFCFIISIRQGDNRGACHQFSETKLDWFDALATCQKMKMCLADIRTKRAFAELAKKFPKHDEQEFWIGLNAYEKDKFKYISNGDIMDYVPEQSYINYKKPCSFIRSIGNAQFIIETGKCGHMRRFVCSEAVTCNGRPTNSSFIPGYDDQLKCSIDDRIKEILGIKKK